MGGMFFVVVLGLPLVLVFGMNLIKVFATPEQRQEIDAAWLKWTGSNKRGGHIRF